MTYYDSSSTKLIDQLTSGLAFTMSSSLTIMKSLSLTLSTYSAASTAVWTFNWQSQVQLTSSTIGYFTISIGTGFTGTPTCQLQPNGAGSATTVSCALSSGTLTLDTSTMSSSTFSNTGNHDDGFRKY